MNKRFSLNYLGIALDPIHIGTGGYRLGRVDITVVRDFDNLPKIPGTTLEGCARHYAALELKNGGCAGTTGCGEDSCQICTTFGYTTQGKSLSGNCQFSDALILLFPVHTMVGPVWVSSPMRLKNVGVIIRDDLLQDGGEKVMVTRYLNGQLPNKGLNLNWLYLPTVEDAFTPDLNRIKLPQEVKDRVVLVSDSIFQQVVNSNLETRTSVAINPETGAAGEGALYTYEAIPRATFLWFEILYQEPLKKDDGGNPILTIDGVYETVQKGVSLFSILGIGGMGTRGFGRMKVVEQVEGDIKRMKLNFLNKQKEEIEEEIKNLQQGGEKR
jgi:CRISPR-associated protein Cmr4